MSAPMGAGRSVEIALQGYVTLQDVCSHVGEIWRRARQQQGLLFAFDCSGVHDFSTLALTALGRLRKHLRDFSCDLAVVKCSASILERRDEPLLAALLAAQPPETAEPDKPPLAGHNRLTPPPSDAAEQAGDPGTQAPHHVRWLVKDYQRYWLN